MSEQKIDKNATVANVQKNEDTVVKPTKKKKRRSVSPLLWVTVIILTLCSTVYFGLIAADQFTSQASFVVRSAKNQSAVTGLGAILQGGRFFAFTR